MRKNQISESGYNSVLHYLRSLWYYLTVFYSNSYDLEIREQAEARNHRIGTENKVTYIDLISEGTVDEKIIYALRNKINLATQTLAEEVRKWLI